VSTSEANRIIAWNLRWLADEVEAGRANADLSIKRDKRGLPAVDRGCVIDVRATSAGAPPPAADGDTVTLGGTRERPIVVDAVRCLCLARTDAGEWCVVDHGGWIEDVGHGVSSFTMDFMPGADWYPSEAEARAAFEGRQRGSLPGSASGPARGIAAGPT
jgi:hypothetical protein